MTWWKRYRERLVVSDNEPFAEGLLTWAKAFLVTTAPPVHKWTHDGYGSFEEIERLAGENSEETLLLYENPRGTRRTVFAWSHGMIEVTRDAGDGQVRAEIVSSNPAFLADRSDILSKRLSRRPPRRSVMTLALNTTGGLCVKELGPMETPLTPENYAPEVQDASRHIAEDLTSTDPCGRLVLLSGPPGTGKSSFIRGLAAEVKALFVLVAPSMIGELSGPQILRLLLDEHDSDEPLVLVLEDAYMALTKRGSDNLALVSEICNLTDGLLGELLNLRVIATTNARRVEIDEAALRPGRLCTDVFFPALTPDQAGAVFRRLTGRDSTELPGENLTLAEVYRLAREDARTPATREPSSIAATGRSLRMGF